MKKVIYEVSTPNKPKFFCSKQQEICDYLNDSYTFDKFTIKSVGYYIYQRQPNHKSKTGITVKRHDTDKFLKKYIDCYLSSISERLDTLHITSTQRLKQQYVIAIQPTIIHALNSNKGEIYMDEQVRLVFPIANIATN
jgi:hypothetical protein